MLSWRGKCNDSLRSDSQWFNHRKAKFYQIWICKQFFFHRKSSAIETSFFSYPTSEWYLQCFANDATVVSWYLPNMMTLSNGNIFRVTDLLCGEFPPQSPVTRRFNVLLICAWINGWVNNRKTADFRHHRAHYDVTVMSLFVAAAWPRVRWKYFCRYVFFKHAWEVYAKSLRSSLILNHKLLFRFKFMCVNYIWWIHFDFTRKTISLFHTNNNYIHVCGGKPFTFGVVNDLYHYVI